MFHKLVAIEPVILTDDAKRELGSYAEQVVLHCDIPDTNDEIIRRIDGADAVLLSCTSTIDSEVIRAAPNLRYIGMCCSLYAPESANVDIAAAERQGITVKAIRDYGDPGVWKYVVSELVRYLHGFGDKQWKDIPVEITGLKAGIIGLGTTGTLIANGLLSCGAEVCYFSRTRKPECEASGIRYIPLEKLLTSVDAVFTCLNKNVVVLYDEQFSWLGDNTMLFNTSIGPSHDPVALKKWLARGKNEFFCDTAGAIGDVSGELADDPHVNCLYKSAGLSQHSYERLNAKALDNISGFLESLR